MVMADKVRWSEVAFVNQDLELVWPLGQIERSVNR